MNRPPLPPFTAETAAQKVRMVEDAWNTRDHVRVALAYATDIRRRIRVQVFQGGNITARSVADLTITRH